MTSLDYHLDKMFALAEGTILNSFSDVVVPKGTILSVNNIHKYLPVVVDTELLIDNLRTRMEMGEISFVGITKWNHPPRFVGNATIRKNKRK